MVRGDHLIRHDFHVCVTTGKTVAIIRKVSVYLIFSIATLELDQLALAFWYIGSPW